MLGKIKRLKKKIAKTKKAQDILKENIKKTAYIAIGAAELAKKELKNLEKEGKANKEKYKATLSKIKRELSNLEKNKNFIKRKLKKILND